ncbi:MAG: tRNA guanosine(34) transglycosylase Tgt [Phycisphaerales bacterium]|nr:tRNA guanosine(34) transglycosylase Tgt [Phycisphaerales bacterium]
MFSFTVHHQDAATRARAGRVVTPHGAFDTPAFMPVGTAGAVKGVTPEQIERTGTQIVLANTYHLDLRPGPEVVVALGGLHRFMGWQHPILTDSGGYQVFSLAEIRDLDDDGVTFRSHIDGAVVRLDPAAAIEIQNKLGADIIMVLDVCPPLPADAATVTQAVERTIRWARQCRRCHGRADQWLFGIVQGGLDDDLRRRCLDAVVEIGFDGYAVGGLSVGESHEDMVRVLDRLAPLMPADRPRYVMGVGMPRDLYACVRAGMDMFDCVLPTRNGRNAYAFTATGPLKLRNEAHRTSDEPLEAGCDCDTCRRFSRGYLRHLFLSSEMLGPILTSIHNLRFFQRLMARMRDLIPRRELVRIESEFPVVTMGREPE